ncbi:MAG TPA: urate hydroxylase PuuD [Vicinamibacteria bacterium]|nr:urate hydroxylase PuuD [Vicinamibacteria bacterium]
MPDLEFAAQAIARWFHILAGIVWIGHLYFFNFVNLPFQGGLAKELKPQVNPPLLLRALYFFRWGAMWTFLFGLLLFYLIYWRGEALWDADKSMSERGMWILFGGLLGTIMWFNVWFVIWPRQKKIIGAMLGGPAAPPEAAPQAALASRINPFLSGPMLWGMVAASHINVWPMKWATLGLAIILAVGAIHGLYASSKKVPTTL